MRNGETKIYRGKDIIKISAKCWRVPGFFTDFSTYYEAKEAIDWMHAENKALSDIDDYVQSVCGGYM